MTALTHSGITVGNQALNQLRDWQWRFESDPWDYEYDRSRFAAGPRKPVRVTGCYAVVSMTLKFPDAPRLWIDVWDALADLPRDIEEAMWKALFAYWPLEVGCALSGCVFSRDLTEPQIDILGARGVAVMTATFVMEGA